MKIYLISINKKMTTIEDYENYTINENGVIINTDSGREKKPTFTNGYYRIGLTKDKKEKFFSIHRLIALTFIPNPDNKPCVDHINRNTQDNRIENLRWVSYSENNMNVSCKSKTGLQHITKNIEKKMKQGFRYQFKINRPDLKHNYSNKELQPVIEYRNKFCAENNIQINDS